MRLSRLLLTATAGIAITALAMVMLGGDLDGALLRLTPLTATLLILVTGLGAVVSTYAARNLEGQRRLGRFALLQVTVVAGLGLVVLAANLVVLALAWTAAGAAMAALVGHAGTPAARAASRLVGRRILAGDVALWLAVALAWLGLGTVELDGLGPAAAGTPLIGALVAVLVVTAGAVRSSLAPWHAWLPETAEAPSPVSALLHAGFVNGLGVLALVLWPLVGESAPARTLALALGLATVVIATAQHRVRPDLKGRLASSTSSQMGYMAVQVGIGLPVGVLVHLVGHGMWKASLFLGAGGAVERVRSAPNVPEVRGRGAAMAGTALAVGVVAAAASIPLPGTVSLFHAPASTLPALVAALATAAAVAAILRRQSGTAAVVLVLAAASAYVMGLRGLEAATQGTFGPVATWGEPGSAGATLALVATVAVGIALVLVDRSLRAGRAPAVVARVASSTMSRARDARVTAPSLVATAASGADGAAAAAGLPGAVTAAVEVARATVAPAWPLHSFVASNPLAGLELLDFHDATGIGARAWGANAGISAALLRSALAEGRVSAADVQAVVVGAGFSDSIVGLGAGASIVTEADVAAAALLADDPRPEPSDGAGPDRARMIAAHHCARVYAETAWSTGATSVWESLRSSGTGLDAALGVTGAAASIAALPADPEEALAALLVAGGRPPREWAAQLGDTLAADPGWVAHLAWRDRVGILAEGAYTDLLAARVALAALVSATGASRAVGSRPEPGADLPSLGFGADVDADTRHRAEEVVARVHRRGVEALRLAAWERSYRTPVLDALASRGRELAHTTSALVDPHASGEAGPDAQVVTCIDVRSERLRRQLEAAGPWETLGAAGFFGLPFTYVDGQGAASERLPALLRPDHIVVEVGTAASASTALHAGLHAIEDVPMAPFALAEASGWISGPYAALRTFAPRILRALSPRRRPTGDLQVVRNGDAGTGFSVDELADAAAAFLRTTGLHSPARLVVLTGHEAHAANNPHVAAYQCGACGGHAGDVSARAMSQALNDPRVRAALRDRGLDLSPTTWFVPAVHDTTRDRVEVIGHAVPEEHRSTIERLQRDLDRAASAVAHERASNLPGVIRPTRLQARLDRRAADWAQVRPEWSLARNAAIVIGPRALTSGLDLDGRVFLQSYRPDADADGSSLDFLMSAPLVVAQWINAQYWCSTVDPQVYGAGDKTTHNTIAAPGLEAAPLTTVVTGARGDLRVGLPWQAVSAIAPDEHGWGEGLPFHDPVRLMAVICAPTERVEAVLAARPEVGRLVLGSWIDLVVVDPTSGALLRRHPSHGWVPVDGAGPLVTADADMSAIPAAEADHAAPRVR